MEVYPQKGERRRNPANERDGGLPTERRKKEKNTLGK